MAVLMGSKGQYSGQRGGYTTTGQKSSYWVSEISVMYHAAASHRALTTPEHINARGDWTVLLPIDTLLRAATIAPDYSSGRGGAGVAKSSPIIDIIIFIHNRRNWRWKGCLW